MRYGLAIPHYDFSFPDGAPVSFAKVHDAVRRAESLGFDSVWISDHFFLSLDRYGGGRELNGSLEPMTTLAALGAMTERIRLGTLVLGPFRHPATLAKMAAAIDLVSHGRLDVGLGAGWFQDEFDAFGYEFGTTGERFTVLEETLAVLRALFEEGPATFEGGHFRLDGAFNHPLPAQRPGPPLWVGAKGGPRALRLAARHADGWNTVWRWTPQDYGERVAEARRICEAVGRDPASLRLSVGLYSLIGENQRDLARRYEALQGWAPGGGLDHQSLEEFATGALVGTLDQVREIVGRFEALGVEEIILCPASVPFAVPDWSVVELFADTLVSGRAGHSSETDSTARSF